MSGYVFCAHAHCFAEIVGSAGDLCDPCKASEADGFESHCDACDHDGGEHAQA